MATAIAWMFSFAAPSLSQEAQEDVAPPEAVPAGPPIEAEEIADPAEEETRLLLEAIIAGDHRSDTGKARDRYRHPVATLLWMGLRPDMTVVEITPGGGWYLNIIAPVLRGKGTYYAANRDAETWWPRSVLPYAQSGADRIRNRLNERPDLFDEVQMTILLEGAGIAPAGTADLVLTFRNVHNWMMAGRQAEVFASAFAALKPGGTFGVVEHRGDPGELQDPKGAKGYVREDAVIELARAAGFELVGSIGINNNPRDTKDYEKGVWTLPPTLRLGDEDHEKYLAIGESDRMTLKFQRPL
ncbi:MAG: methyltransferase [Myxococcota bacterium]